MISRDALPDRRLGLLIAGVVLLLFAAVGGSVALPSSDPSLDDASPQRRTLDAEATRGLEVYRTDGCATCHTQQVRELRSDTGLGAPLLAGDYPDGAPALLGAERLGPDLTHVGTRGVDPAKLHAHARWLSDDEVSRLTAYLKSLQ